MSEARIDRLAPGTVVSGYEIPKLVGVCGTELMAKIHNRMPVILPEGARDTWLDPTAGEAELRGLLVPLPPEELEAYEVSALVNSPRNDSPECTRPAE